MREYKTMETIKFYSYTEQCIKTQRKRLEHLQDDIYIDKCYINEDDNNVFSGDYYIKVDGVCYFLTYGNESTLAKLANFNFEPHTEYKEGRDPVIGAYAICGKLDIYEQHAQKFFKWQEEEQQRKQLAQQQAKIEREQKLKDIKAKQLSEAIARFKALESLTLDQIFILCDHYKINIHPRTKGSIIDNISSIYSSDGKKYDNYYRNKISKKYKGTHLSIILEELKQCVLS